MMDLDVDMAEHVTNWDDRVALRRLIAERLWVNRYRLARMIPESVENVADEIAELVQRRGCPPVTPVDLPQPGGPTMNLLVDARTGRP